MECRYHLIKVHFKEVIMFCSNCGSQIPDGSAFCPNCGTRSNAHEMAVNAGNINQTVVTRNFIVSTLEAIPGKEVEILGIAKGSIVSSRNVGKDILSGFKNMAGGEIAGYTELAESAYSTALERMKSQAMSMGADAIIGRIIDKNRFRIGMLFNRLSYPFHCHTQRDTQIRIHFRVDINRLRSTQNQSIDSTSMHISRHDNLFPHFANAHHHCLYGRRCTIDHKERM